MKYGLSFDLLSEDRIKSTLTTKLLANKIYAFWSISTTNEFAYRRALQGEKEGALVIAERQERGRGRKSRVWDSQVNRGLWFSLILRPDLPATKVGLIPFIGGLSVAEAVENYLNLKPDLKWPNDLLLNGKKFCGMLSEVEFKDGKVDFVVLGIGVNVNHRAGEWPNELKDKATSLRIVAEKRVDRAEMLAQILSKLEENYEKFKVHGAEDILNEWKKRCSKFKKNITIVQDDTRLEGKFYDLNDDGCLILKTRAGDMKTIIAGDIINS